MKILSRTLKALVFLCLTCFFTANVKAAIAPVDISITQNNETNLSGVMFLDYTSQQIDQATFYILEKDSKKMVFQHQIDLESADGTRGVSLNFDLQVSNTGLNGEYLLYAGLLNPFGKRVAMGRIPVSMNTSAASAEPLVEIKRVEVEKTGTQGLAKLTFTSSAEGKILIPSVEIFEHSLRNKKVSDHHGDPTETQYGEQTIQFYFPWPQKPEVYPLLFSLITSSGSSVGGEIIETIRQEGRFAEIFGVIPKSGTSIDAKEIEITMEGATPTDQDYLLELKLEHLRDGKSLSEETKTHTLTKGSSGAFSIKDTFSIKPKSLIQLAAMITDPQSGEILEEKEFQWVSNGGTLPTETNTNTPTTDENVKTVNPSSMPLIIFGLGLVLLLLLVFLFQKHKKHLNGFILLLLGGVFMHSSVSAAELNTTGYEANIYPLTHQVFTTNPTDDNIGKGDGFNTLFISGSITNESALADKKDLFFKQELEGKRLTGATVIVQPNVSANRSQTATIGRNSISFEKVTLPDLTFYEFSLSLKLANLDSGKHSVKIVFNFENGAGEDTYTIDSQTYGDFYPLNIEIDTESPSLKKSESDFFLDPNKVNIDFAAGSKTWVGNKQDTTVAITCPDCDPEGGSTQLLAEVKGNFCANGSGKICDIVEGKRTYEVCDSLQNCSKGGLSFKDPRIGNTENRDLFFYDPFPPLLQLAEIFRIRTTGTLDTGETYQMNDEEIRNIQIPRVEDSTRTISNTLSGVVDERGQTSSGRAGWKVDDTNKNAGNIAAHNRFTLNPIERDDQFDPAGEVIVNGIAFADFNNSNKSGPYGDPTACGEFEYGDKKRVGGASHFFYADSISGGGQVCTQRFVACSNAAGHRGLWDRQKNPGSFQPEYCEGNGALPYEPVTGRCGGLAGSKLTETEMTNFKANISANLLCETGWPTEITGSGPWSWTCEGYNRGGSQTCNVTKKPIGGPNPVDGLCGAIDGTNLSGADLPNEENDRCYQGSQSTPTRNGNVWEWQCTGYNSGAIDNCSATLPPDPISGSCVQYATSLSTPPLAGQTPPETCATGSTGTVTPVMGGGKIDRWTWSCNGLNGGSNVTTCSANAATTNGACAEGSTISRKTAPTNLCESGTAVFAGGGATPPLIGTEVGQKTWDWTCEGNNGDDAPCSTSFDETGRCGSANGVAVCSGNPTGNLCEEGLASIPSFNAETNEWSWSCGTTSCGASVSASVCPLPQAACGVHAGIGQRDSNGVLIGGLSFEPSAPNLCGTNSSLKDSVTIVLDEDDNPTELRTWTCQGTDTSTIACNTYVATTTPALPVCGANVDGKSYLSAADIPQAGRCDAGTPTPLSALTAANTWTWKCDLNGTLSRDCTAIKYDAPVIGVCATITLDVDTSVAGVQVAGEPAVSQRCEEGTPSNLTWDSLSKTWYWTCNGTNGGGNSNLCSGTFTNGQTDGRCGFMNQSTFGAAPTGGLCSVGSPSVVTENTNQNIWAWECAGANGGNTDYCFVRKDTSTRNGACGISAGRTFGTLPQTDLCSIGAPNPIPVDLNGTQWAWECSGINGGTPTSCTAVKGTGPGTNGQCGITNGLASYSAPTPNCTSPSTPTALVAGISGPWFWTCNSNNGGQAAHCRVNQKNDGQCGTLPALTLTPAKAYESGSNLCDTGLNTAPTCTTINNNTTCTWTCNGILGGQPQSCSKSIIEQPVAQCSPQSGSTVTVIPSPLCQDSALASAVTSNGNRRDWTCSYPNTTPTSCFVNIDTTVNQNGACHLNPDPINQTNLCAVGRVESFNDENQPTYTWTCKGSGSGTDASCSKTITTPVPFPSCGAAHGTITNTTPANPNLCGVGTASAVAGDGTNENWTWTCSNTTGSANCTATPLTVGQCGAANNIPRETAPTTDFCNNGTYVAGTPTATQWNWKCNGNNSGVTTDDDNCSAPILPITIGACGASHGTKSLSQPTNNLCITPSGSTPTVTFGQYQDGAQVKTGWTWQCAGTTPAFCHTEQGAGAQCGASAGIVATNTPQTNLCSKGLVVGGVKEVGSIYQWQCENEFTAVSCETQAPTCPAGHYWDNATKTCRPGVPNQCSPTGRTIIINQNGGIGNIWLNSAGATQLNQDWTKDTVDRIGTGECLYGCETVPTTPAPAACSFGCRYGEDPVTGRCASCFTDKFPYCLPLCFDGSVMTPGPDGTMGTADDVCEEGT